MHAWTVTYAAISAEDGETTENGLIADSLSLQDALTYWKPRTSACDGGSAAANEYPIHAPRWFTKTYDEYETGDSYEVTLHIPQAVTPSSRRRLARVLGVTP